MIAKKPDCTVAICKIAPNSQKCKLKRKPKVVKQQAGLVKECISRIFPDDFDNLSLPSCQDGSGRKIEFEMLLQIIRPCDPAEPACILANFFLRPPNCDKDNHQKDARCTKLKLEKDPIKSIVKTDTTTIKNTINKNTKTKNPHKDSKLFCFPSSRDPRCRNFQQTSAAPTDSQETSTVSSIFGWLLIIIIQDLIPLFDSFSPDHPSGW